MSEKRASRADELGLLGYLVKKCKGCGRNMVWGRTPTEQWIPLDPAAPVYHVLMIRDRHNVPHQTAVHDTEAFVVHGCKVVSR